MGSTASAILDVLAADLARPDGLDPYTYDLSAEDRVKVGEYGRPWLSSVPCACIAVDDVSSGFDASLGRYARKMTCRWRAWVPLTSSDLGLAEKAALDVLSDVLTALEVSRKKGAGATMMLASGVMFVGPLAEGGGSLYAHAGGTVEMTYRLTTGG